MRCSRGVPLDASLALPHLFAAVLGGFCPGRAESSTPTAIILISVVLHLVGPPGLGGEALTSLWSSAPALHLTRYLQ